MLSPLAAQLDLGELLSRIPLDANAVAAYGVLAVLVALIWWNKHSEPELSPPYDSVEPQEDQPDSPDAL